MKTYAKRFNAQRAAKAAGHSSGDIEIIKTKNGFTYRVKGSAPVEKTTQTAKVEAIPPKGREDPKTADKFEMTAKRPLGKRAAIEAGAREGRLPEPPDFSAPTHARFRNKLASVVNLAKAGDISGLRALEINPVSSSPKAIARYRDLCILALKARG